MLGKSTRTGGPKSDKMSQIQMLDYSVNAWQQHTLNLSAQKPKLYKHKKIYNIDLFRGKNFYTTIALK
jgi:hypothetical protein